MPGSSPSAVCFDLDGTLIDSEPVWIQAEIDIMSRYGAQWDVDDQHFCLGGPLPKVATRMREKSGDQATVSEFMRELIDEMVERLGHVAVPWLPGAADAVLSMAELGPVALVTASPRELVEPLLDAMHADLGIPYSLVITGDDLERTKPHPDPYRHAVNVFAASPRDVMVVEDSVTGCTSAARASCIVVARAEHTPLLNMDPDLHEYVLHVPPHEEWNLLGDWERHPLNLTVG